LDRPSPAGLTEAASIRDTHEALRDHADRVRLNVAEDKVFEVYRELIEQVASDAYDAGANVDDAGCLLLKADMLSVGTNVCYVPQADIVGDLTNAAAHDDPKDRAVSFPLNENRATLCRQRGPALLNDMHEIPSCGI
jgi:hypothetical protein